MITEFFLAIEDEKSEEGHFREWLLSLDHNITDRGSSMPYREALQSVDSKRECAELEV